MKPSKADVVKAIRLTWLSLDSHLDYSIDAKQQCESCGNERFHAKTAREYAHIISVLSGFL